MAAYERVYEQILSRVARDELAARCRDVAHKDARALERRVGGAARALQLALDLEAARRALAVPVAPAALALVDEIDALRVRVAARMHELRLAVVKHETRDEPTTKQEPLSFSLSSPTRTSKKRRRLSVAESVDSPLKPPRPGRLAVAEEEPTDEDDERRGPHQFLAGDEEDGESTEDEVPLELDVLDSDTEAEMAAYLDKARRLRKISSDRRMGELPGLIDKVLREAARHAWAAMPRDLLGTLSATFGAATTLKTSQRRELRDTLAALRDVALQIDDATAKRYPTLRVSTARFLSSVGEIFPVESPEQDDSEQEDATIEELHAATVELAERMDNNDDAKSMEEIEELLTRVDHVFDNPTLARSRRYGRLVAASLSTLLKYVDAIPRNTRSKRQCLDLLNERLEQLADVAR